MQKLLSIMETASLLGVSSSLLYKLTERKEMPNIRIGGRILFSESILDEWVKGKTIQGGKE